MISPISAITTPAISSLRSKGRFAQKDDTGTWREVCLPAALDRLELPLVDLRARVLVFRREVVGLLVFLRVVLLPPAFDLDVPLRVREVDDFRDVDLDFFLWAM